MSAQKPLVLNSGLPSQLQSPNDLDIPLADRVHELEKTLGDLARYLTDQNIPIPDSLLKYIDS